MTRQTPNEAFTLIELLVVISIISLLSSVVLASLSGARQSAKVASSVSTLRELKRAGVNYINDTSQLPPDCRISCTKSSDPFFSNPGVSGWDGPYFELWNFTHPWGGQIGFSVRDLDGDGNSEPVFVFDDDLPGTGAGNNEGKIPTEQLKEIDRILDDGDLTTGNVIGGGYGSTATGELMLIANI